VSDAPLLITCEHGGARVPARYAALFDGRERLLASHRGLDRGALPLARDLARALDAECVVATTTRLLVDLNRSLDHPRLFSAFTRALPRADRATLIRRHWRPHRDAVTARVERLAMSGRRVVHIAVHSFAPVLGGARRPFEIGLLYDPARAPERRFAAAWHHALAREAPALRVRRNRPYRGTADGLTTALRRAWPPSRYLGIELEVNQRLLIGEPGRARAIARTIADSLGAALAASAPVRQVAVTAR
jgi:predicted N-formylglutamate amidohydrolase